MIMYMMIFHSCFLGSQNHQHVSPLRGKNILAKDETIFCMFHKSFNHLAFLPINDFILALTTFTL